MAGDYMSGLEIESDIFGAHLLFREMANTNAVSLQTPQINQAGWAIFPSPPCFYCSSETQLDAGCRLDAYWPPLGCFCSLPLNGSSVSQGE